MSYTPQQPPSRDADLAEYVIRELQEIARSMTETQELELRQVSKAPKKPRLGMIVYADGTNWDPGFGEGVYVYTSSGWLPVSATPGVANWGGINGNLADQTDLQTVLDRRVMTFNSVAELTNCDTTTFSGSHAYTKGYHAAADYADGRQKGGSWYVWNALDVATGDGITRIVDASGRRWILQHDGTLRISQCGAKLDLVADDLGPINAGIALLNTGTRINRLTFDARTVYISDTIDPITKGGVTVEGLGGADSTRLTMMSSAGDVGTMFQLGTASETAQRVTIRGFGFYFDNSSSLTGNEWTIWFRNSSACQLIFNYFNSSCINVSKHGGATTSEASIQDIIIANRGSLRPIEGTFIHDFRSCTGLYFTANFFSGTGVGIPNARICRFKPTGGGEGLDGNMFVCCGWNFNATDMDYGFEFDGTQPAITNHHFTNCTMDAGRVANTLLKIGTGASVNSRIYNMTWAGNRMTASNAHASDGGGWVHVVQDSDYPIHGIVFSANVVGVGCDYPPYRHDRDPAVGTNQCFITFKGNSINTAAGSSRVRMATTANITLSGLQTIDTVVGVANDLVLVKNQTTASENGIYLMKSTAWTRSAQYDDWDTQLAELKVYVLEGATNKGLWESDGVLGGVLGTTALNFTLISPQQNGFEIDSDNIIITDNSFGVVEGDILDIATAPFIDYIAVLLSATIKNVVVENNLCPNLGKNIAVDVSALSSTNLRAGPHIGRNANCFENPIRMVQTTNATITTLGAQSLPDGNYRIECVVTGEQDASTNYASYLLKAWVTVSGGTATINTSSFVAEHESDAAWDAIIDASSSNIRIRVTGKAGTTINWRLFPVRIIPIN